MVSLRALNKPLVRNRGDHDHSKRVSSREPKVEEQLHKPVMVEEALSWLAVSQGGVFLDCTLGLGGHAEAVLERVSGAIVIGLDRDGEAIAHARNRLDQFGGRFRALKANYKDAVRVLGDLGIASVDGVLVDMGVSSLQLGRPDRGFAFQFEAPLDMRMDQEQSRTASDLVHDLSEEDLADIIFRYGEEPGSRRVARAIVRQRAKARIETTRQLADVVVRALHPKGRWKTHPATRTFQALRIAVNEELSGLDRFVAAAAGLLKGGGRLAIITFHSLEDRLVKQAFRSLSGQCICPPDVWQCVCGASRVVKVLTKKPVLPSEEEIRENPRARSAKLRVCEKIA